MSKLTERANYLRGLADGLQLNEEKPSNLLVMEIIDLLGEITDEIEALQADHGELSDFVDAIDEDLGLLEEDVADLEDSLPPCSPPKPHDGPFDKHRDGPFDRPGPGEDWPFDPEDGDDDHGDEDEDEVTYSCPHCGAEVILSVDGFDFDEDMPCPHCGKPLFPEGDEEAEEEAKANETDGDPDEAPDDDDLPDEDED